LALLLNFISSGLDLSSPFFVKRLIDFISNKEEDTWLGLMLVALLVLTQIISYFINEHINFYQKMIGVKSTNALISYIYKK
jgi:ABC-type multidrug transport system fused ATPase/permease subunit